MSTAHPGRLQNLADQHVHRSGVVRPRARSSYSSRALPTKAPRSRSDSLYPPSRCLLFPLSMRDAVVLQRRNSWLRPVFPVQLAYREHSFALAPSRRVCRKARGSSPVKSTCHTPILVLTPSVRLTSPPVRLSACPFLDRVPLHACVSPAPAPRTPHPKIVRNPHFHQPVPARPSRRW